MQLPASHASALLGALAGESLDTLDAGGRDAHRALAARETGTAPVTLTDSQARALRDVLRLRAGLGELGEAALAAWEALDAHLNCLDGADAEDALAERDTVPVLTADVEALLNALGAHAGEFDSDLFAAYRALMRAYSSFAAEDVVAVPAAAAQILLKSVEPTSATAAAFSQLQAGCGTPAGSEQLPASDEAMLVLANGRTLAFDATDGSCGYVRVLVGDATQVARWELADWTADPAGAMAAILSCASGGALAPIPPQGGDAVSENAAAELGADDPESMNPEPFARLHAALHPTMETLSRPDALQNGIDAIHGALEDALALIAPDVTVKRSGHFNHSYVADFTLAWPDMGEQATRDMLLRMTLDDPMHRHDMRHFAADATIIVGLYDDESSAVPHETDTRCRLIPLESLKVLAAHPGPVAQRLLLEGGGYLSPADARAALTAHAADASRSD